MPRPTSRPTGQSCFSFQTWAASSSRSAATISPPDEQKTVLAPDWDVWGAEFSKSGKYLIVWINEDAAFATRLYDAATLQEVRQPGMPDGVVRGLRLSRDDTKLAFYASDGSVPDDLYAGQVGRAPTRLTKRARIPRSSATTSSCRRVSASSPTTASRSRACCTRRTRCRHLRRRPRS